MNFIQAAIPIVSTIPKGILCTAATDTDYAKLPGNRRSCLVAPEVHYKEEYTPLTPERL